MTFSVSARLLSSPRVVLSGFTGEDSGPCHYVGRSIREQTGRSNISLIASKRLDLSLYYIGQHHAVAAVQPVRALLALPDGDFHAMEVIFSTRYCAASMGAN
ncbi:hypothetical protein RY831_29585 [Noviherbaspirillum sp. CPCC 100848]|uniref:Uncharacterized protein n=1 Tax=Noviherbaspirillum album TaxID=3080276 RepID=A0ABU6JIH6_9BURK|nr:hypothetical protein [Noviherbaspirillum sp. CPCC 100848]MEC4723313.1 hypothetical protein [Noviherbaspirillum sp. CPCC 100848]